MNNETINFLKNISIRSFEDECILTLFNIKEELLSMCLNMHLSTKSDKIYLKNLLDSDVSLQYKRNFMLKLFENFSNRDFVTTLPMLADSIYKYKGDYYTSGNTLSTWPYNSRKSTLTLERVYLTRPNTNIVELNYIEIVGLYGEYIYFGACNFDFVNNEVINDGSHKYKLLDIRQIDNNIIFVEITHVKLSPMYERGKYKVYTCKKEYENYEKFNR